jgi:hypothetical protein
VKFDGSPFDVSSPQTTLAKEKRIMRKLTAVLAITLTVAGFAMSGCGESEAPKKAPEQKSDLGAPASPSPAKTDAPAKH